MVAGPRLADVEQILVVGHASLDGSLLAALGHQPVPLIVCDPDGRTIFEWLPEDSAAHAELLTAQVRFSQDESFRLGVGRELIAAKLLNYAALAEAYPDRRQREPLAPKLRELAGSARTAAAIDQLLGFEGAGTAAWYQTLRGRLPGKFSFRGRVAPNADDPVNVMVNIAQTHLYRQARIAARLVGLTPAIGFLHQPRAGFAPLAGDLQEPFRMLMDRAVIETAYRIVPREFTRREHAPFPLQVSFNARRRLLGAVYETLHTVVAGPTESDPVTYRQHLIRLARGIRRSLLAGRVELNVFCFPNPSTPQPPLVS